MSYNNEGLKWRIRSIRLLEQVLCLQRVQYNIVVGTTGCTNIVAIVSVVRGIHHCNEIV